MEHPKRQKAREAIVRAANRHRRRRKGLHLPDGYVFLPPAFTMRHLQRCVHICRQNRLVKPIVYAEAGFNS